MPGLELAVLGLGRALTKLGLSLWLDEAGSLAAISAAAIEAARQPATDTAQSRESFQRNLRQAPTEAVGRLSGLLAREFVDLPENEQRAAVEAVSATLESAALGAEDLFTHDLDGQRLRRHLRDRDPDRSIRAGLSTAAEVLYDRLLIECCQYLAETVRALPGANMTAVSELLRRLTRLESEVREVNDQLAATSAQTNREPAWTAAALAGASLTPPVGTLPPRLRGRDDVMSRLHQAVGAASGKLVVLAGLGGVGKSTIALELSRRVRETGQGQSWWISAASIDSFIDGWLGLAEELDANHSVREAVRAGAGRGRDRVWSLLEQAQPGWLLVIDNADDPRALDPCDGTGWLRSSTRGLVLVTSRVHDPRTWGSHAEVCQVEALADMDAAAVLLDLAPHAGTEAEARHLAQRLGGLPLALQLTGSNLSSRWTEWRTFADCLRALDAGHTSRVLAVADDSDKTADLRAAVTSTWEMSLDSLADSGSPHCRPLLRMLSCYSPSAPVPVGLLVPALLRELVGSPAEECDDAVHRRVIQGIEKLSRLGLVRPVEPPARPFHQTGRGNEPRRPAGGPGLTIHPVVAEISRFHLVKLTPIERGGVQRAAVELVARALEPLRCDDHRDWPTFQSVAPHVVELLDTSGVGLDRELSARLLTVLCLVVAYRTWSGAERSAERLARVGLARVDHLGDRHPVTLRLRNELAWAIGRQDRWDEAEPLLRGVLDAQERILGDTHVDTLDTRHKWAWAVGKRGDWLAAERTLRKVLADRRQRLGAEHPDTLHSQCCHAWATSACGRPTEAERAYRELLALRGRVLGEDHLETLDTQHSLAEMLVRNGRYRDGEALLRQVISIRSDLLGPDCPETMDIRPRYWLAVSLGGQGRHAEANAEFSRLLASQVRDFGLDHPTVEAIRSQLRPAL